jgi:uncharacterized sporulation protein YeaH/YhbH (DUF444 family)
MVQGIERDVGRFKQIVRGKIREDLRKYVSNGEMIGKRGKDLVSIPLPQLNIPHFRYGKNGKGGVSSGDGKPGQPLGGDPDDEEGAGKAGGDAGRHILEVDVPLAELAAILGEELELPRIQPKGKPNIVDSHNKYSGVAPQGPDSLRHFKRTFKRALKRQLTTNTYNPGDPRIVPIKDDERFRSWKKVIEPQSNAVVFYMMDVSGSMGDEQKEIVRIESFWIDCWLRSQYKGIDNRYIIHDAEAKEVDHHTFFHTRENGGTRISSAYKAATEVIDRNYPASEWNIYVLHFTDGDNWGEDDEQALSLLRDKILPTVNLFGYAQVVSPYGSGRFMEELQTAVGDAENVALSEIPGKEGILGSIKTLLGKGK